MEFKEKWEGKTKKRGKKKKNRCSRHKSQFTMCFMWWFHSRHYVSQVSSQYEKISLVAFFATFRGSNFKKFKGFKNKLKFLFPCILKTANQHMGRKKNHRLVAHLINTFSLHKLVKINEIVRDFFVPNPTIFPSISNRDHLPAHWNER